jgi:predicted double-glycine peptidase
MNKKMLFLVFLILSVIIKTELFSQDEKLTLSWEKFNIPKTKIKIPLQDIYQENLSSCGPAVLTSVINYFGKGPIEEKEIHSEISLTEYGTDPYQIKYILELYGLRYKEYRNMTILQLKECIDKSIPVIMMIQAWGKEINKSSYIDNWENGHWVVAIGYDSERFYFEDPSITGAFGFIESDSLNIRWHDVEYLSKDNIEIHYTYNYGIAVWNSETVFVARKIE